MGAGPVRHSAFIIPPASLVWVRVLEHAGARPSRLSHGDHGDAGRHRLRAGRPARHPVRFRARMSPSAEFVLSPYILALQIAPKVAFAPLFIIWFGYTVYPKILVCVLIVFFHHHDQRLRRGAGARSRRRAAGQVLHRTTACRFSGRSSFPPPCRPLLPAFGLRPRWRSSASGGRACRRQYRAGLSFSVCRGSGDTAKVFVTIILLTLIGIVLYGIVVAIETRVLHYLPARARLAT